MDYFGYMLFHYFCKLDNLGIFVGESFLRVFLKYIKINNSPINKIIRVTGFKKFKDLKINNKIIQKLKNKLFIKNLK